MGLSEDKNHVFLHTNAHSIRKTFCLETKEESASLALPASRLTKGHLAAPWSPYL